MRQPAQLARSRAHRSPAGSVGVDASTARRRRDPATELLTTRRPSISCSTRPPAAGTRAMYCDAIVDDDEGQRSSRRPIHDGARTGRSSDSVRIATDRRRQGSPRAGSDRRRSTSARRRADTRSSARPGSTPSRPLSSAVVVVSCLRLRAGARVDHEHVRDSASCRRRLRRWRRMNAICVPSGDQAGESRRTCPASAASAFFVATSNR